MKGKIIKLLTVVLASCLVMLFIMPATIFGQGQKELIITVQPGYCNETTTFTLQANEYLNDPIFFGKFVILQNGDAGSPICFTLLGDIDSDEWTKQVLKSVPKGTHIARFTIFYQGESL